MDVESLIRKYVSFVSTSSSGYNNLVCKVCNDHGSKGPRAGFKFMPDGTVLYNCFNEPHNCNAVYKPGERVSNKFLKILDSYSVPRNEFFSLIKREIRTKDVIKSLLEQKEKVKTVLNYSELDHEITETLIPLTEKDKQYLRKREIDERLWSRFASSDHPKYKNFVWIKIKYKSKVIAVQGRSTREVKRGKYLTLTNSKYIHYNIDYIFDNTIPIIIVEGIFDAIRFPNAVALLGQRINPDLIQHLNDTKRLVYVVPDKIDNYKNSLAPIAEKLTYSKVFDISDYHVKDLDDLTKKVGVVAASHLIVKYSFSDTLKLKLLV